MRRIYRTIEVTFGGKTVKGLAVIDPGMPKVVIPRSWGDALGATGRRSFEGKLDLGGRDGGGAIRRFMFVKVQRTGGLGARRTQVVIPERYGFPNDPKRGEVALVGSLYLQKRGAVISYDEGVRFRRNPKWVEQGFGLGEDLE